MSNMRDPYGVLIGKGCSTTLLEAQERACEIDTTSSLNQEEECLEKIIHINQVDDFVVPDPPCNIRTYLQKKQEVVAKKNVGHIISLMDKEK